MKLSFLFALVFVSVGFSQDINSKISTIDFVEILNGNREEAIFYFENNWKVLREMAIEKNQIDSYQLLEVESTSEAPFNLIMITTYKNKQQYDAREEHFQKLIAEKGELKLLNNKTPGEFRRSVYSKETVH